MPKFVKKPVEIIAYQFDGTYESLMQINELFPKLQTLSSEYHKERNIVNHWKIGTLEGGHNVSKGDWIIQGIKGEYYPCKPDIFVATYDLVQ